jgi:hypothetical protein
MRGIHPSHYGRICPIETPEGKNAGLVNSLTSYTRVGPEGLETPTTVSRRALFSEERFPFLSSQRKRRRGRRLLPPTFFLPAPLLPTTRLPLRRGDNLIDNFNQAARERIQYVGISRIQMISIATSLIPFLEHNDANRALMGQHATPGCATINTGAPHRRYWPRGSGCRGVGTCFGGADDWPNLLRQWKNDPCAAKGKGRRETAWSPRIKPRVSALLGEQHP